MDGNLHTIVMSNVSHDGHISILLSDSSQLRIVQALIALAALRSKTIPLARRILKNGTYLYWSEKMEKWLRVRALSNLPSEEGKYFVDLLDVGVSAQVEIGSLRDLTAIAHVLVDLPHQATEVLLARVPPSNSLLFTQDAVNKLKELVPSTAKMRVCSITPDGVPIIELVVFEQNKSIVVNDELAKDTTLFKAISRPRPQQSRRPLKNRFYKGTNYRQQSPNKEESYNEQNWKAINSTSFI